MTFDQIAGRKMEVIRLAVAVTGQFEAFVACPHSPACQASLINPEHTLPPAQQSFQNLADWHFYQTNLIYHPRSLLVIRLKMYNFFVLNK